MSHFSTGVRFWDVSGCQHDGQVVRLLMDPKRIVANGYDRLAERYRAWSGAELAGPRATYVDRLWELLPAVAQVLELGCATGRPVAEALARRFAVTGVDISPRQIKLARSHVPEVDFVVTDMMALALPKNSFDAVVSFYSFVHLPRKELPALLTNITAWLRPDGWLVANFAIGDDPGTVESDWLGTPMYFSSYDIDTTKRLVTAAGLEIQHADLITDDEDGVPVTFLWIIAQKMASGSSC